MKTQEVNKASFVNPNDMTSDERPLTLAKLGNLLNNYCKQSIFVSDLPDLATTKITPGTSTLLNS